MPELMIRFIEVSKNRKTGPIPVSSAPMSTCSPTCPFNVGDDGRVLTENGETPKCYGGFGNSRIHWTNLSKGKQSANVTDWMGFVERVRRLPHKQLWRHDEVGDLPHHKGLIDSDRLSELVRANRKKRGFTYTHHDLNAHNALLINSANNNGFTVNVSCNSVHEMKVPLMYGFPVVVILPSDAPNVQTVDGTKVVACPAEKSDNVTCASCGLCQNAKRDYVIGFRAHSSGKKHANVIARG